MNSATDELRRLLNEHGVEWTEPNNDERSRTTYWTADVFSCIAVEFTDGVVSVSLTAHRITPEQAIEATLGSGEYEDELYGLRCAIGALKTENAKLRELVRRMFYAVHPADREKFLTNVAELGVDVGE